ncbi:acyl-CoA thioesterase [Daejeonella sp.]|jgi:acyl-CoA thioester hydrolase|uniref:acyl-CoA thioesterase n=1 Tax=Daejeonella sp. TaxID=2805397 RepID=UPI0037BED857
MTNRQHFTIEDFKYRVKIPIRFADIDVFGHVNNAIYLTYFEMARSSYWDDVIEWKWDELGIIIRRSLVDYLKPIHLNDEIYAYVKTSRIGNSSFDLDYILVKIIDGKEEICTSGQTMCVTFDYKSKLSVPIPEKQRNKMIEN